MICLEDRQNMAQDINAAHEAGARLSQACQEVGIDVRTLQRWKAKDGLSSGDGRPRAARPTPAHALSAAERARVLDVANEPRFADMPPARIVPALADEGVYVASESTFCRILRAHGQNARRGRAKAPRTSRPPTTHVATAPRQVWSWDMSYLPAAVAGRWFYLYLILDIYSRMYGPDALCKPYVVMELVCTHVFGSLDGQGVAHARSLDEIRAPRPQQDRGSIAQPSAVTGSRDAGLTGLSSRW